MKLKLDIKPLSVNAVWQGKRFKTPAYLRYERDALMLLPRKNNKSKQPLIVKYVFYLTKRQYSLSDVGNFEKPLTDILVKSGVIYDDRYIVKITMEKRLSDKSYIEINIKRVKNEG